MYSPPQVNASKFSPSDYLKQSQRVLAGFQTSRIDVLDKIYVAMDLSLEKDSRHRPLKTDELVRHHLVHDCVA